MKKIDLEALDKFRVFGCAIILFLLIVSIALFAFKEKEKNLKIFAQEQLYKTANEKNIVETRLISTIRTKKIVEEELNEEREKSSALEKNLREKEQQINVALNKLQKETTARREAEVRLITVIKDKEALETKVRQLDKLPKVFELEKIVIKSTPTLTGKVLAVNSEYAFIIIDLGKINNLNLGDFLSVYRKDKFIGRVQIESVEEDVCAATILPKWQNKKFKENDEVRVLL